MCTEAPSAFEEMLKSPADLTMCATTAMLATPSQNQNTTHTNSSQGTRSKGSRSPNTISIPPGPTMISTSPDPFAANTNLDTKHYSTIDSIRLRNLVHSPLLRLPRELRDIITSYTLITSPPPHHSSLASVTSAPTKPSLPPLLQTCSLLRPECAEIYYSTKLLLAGGAPSPKYEIGFFNGFDEGHKKFLKRCHWLWDAYGTREQAMRRAGELDRLTGTRAGVWTVGFIDVFDLEGRDVGRGRAVYVNCLGEVREPGRI